MPKVKKFDRKFNKEKSVVVGMTQGLTVDEAIDAVELEERIENHLASEQLREIAISLGKGIRKELQAESRTRRLFKVEKL